MMRDKRNWQKDQRTAAQAEAKQEQVTAEGGMNSDKVPRRKPIVRSWNKGWSLLDWSLLATTAVLFILALTGAVILGVKLFAPVNYSRPSTSVTADSAIVPANMTQPSTTPALTTFTSEPTKTLLLVSPTLSATSAQLNITSTATPPSVTSIPKVGQRAYSLTIQLNYLLYLPPDYGKDPQQQWPLVLYLHGVGERGNDPNQVAKGGLPKLVRQGQDFPFILLSPQDPPGLFWADIYPYLITLLDNIESNYSVDRERIYLTGVSMGAYGAMGLAQQYPDRFAALVPIAGGYTWDPKIPTAGGYTLDLNAPIPERICEIKDVPIWLFHGAKDVVIPPSQSEHIVDALEKCGGHPKFTLYPNADHVASWELAYVEPTLYEWLLQQAMK